MYISKTACTDCFSARFMDNSFSVLARTSSLLHQLFILNMEVVKGRRNNSEKRPCFDNYFFQLENR